MRIKLISSLVGLALLPLTAMADMPTPGVAAGPTDTVLVEIINFHCPRCHAVNDQFDTIAQAAKEAKIPLRVAPAAWEGQSLWPDRFYYAVRDLFPGAENIVRDALFDGIQREGQNFEELPQIISFLERRQLPQRIKQTVPKFDLLAVADRAASDITLVSEVKVGRLVDMSGATEVPVFAWVHDGKIKQLISPADASEPGPLVQKVLHKLNESTK
ncbi:DNA repair protein RadA [Novimethylophilus kurashikiensis]|uniref:DNA repair protein RadA n=1 Tax=Novimethylophilus kurashikiensis TaxID=1825523 RepID=A0A2R5FA26_9PROT|nr:hypothetical protein [Novimethylophilus kurashikiensis]GBG14398.1 DNA repair protein RadA [Novimethylophilus kurashikiensis]